MNPCYSFEYRGADRALSNDKCKLLKSDKNLMLNKDESNVPPMNPGT